MIQKLITKFGTRAMIKFGLIILAVVMTALFSTIAYMSWQISSKDKKIELQAATISQYEATISQHEQTIKDQNATIKQQLSELQLRDELAADNRAKQQAIDEENSKLKRELRKLENENAEIAEYSASLMPDDIVSLLKQATTDSDQNRGGESPPPGTIPGADTSSGTTGYNQWRPCSIHVGFKECSGFSESRQSYSARMAGTASSG